MVDDNFTFPRFDSLYIDLIFQILLLLKYVPATLSSGGTAMVPWCEKVVALRQVQCSVKEPG